MQMGDVLQQLQHLNIQDVEQVLDHLDNDTRDFLLQAMGHAIQEDEPTTEDGRVEPRAASEDMAPVDAAAADAEAEAPGPAAEANEPNMLQRAWNALWGT